MLSFAEEIYLLALDNTTGKVYNYSDEISLSYALVGAILCELSFVGKIDADIENIIVIDKIPTGNKILDSILNVIAEEGTKKPTSYWLKALLHHANKVQKLVLSELVNKRILKIVDKKIFWKFYIKRNHIINNEEVSTLETRIRELVLNEKEIPAPREAALIGLIQACHLFETILSPRESLRAKKRIENLAKLDMIGREVVNMISKIKNSSLRIFHND